MGSIRLQRPRQLAAAVARRLEAFSFRRGRTLPLFDALAHSETALDDLANGTAASIDRTVLSVRLREILILRTLAQWNARAEWDVHALLYAPVAPLSQSEVEWLGGARPYVAWGPRERLLIDLADALRAGASVPDNLWEALRGLFSEQECAEILMVATQYVKVALLTRALNLPALVPDGPAIVEREGCA